MSASLSSITRVLGGWHKFNCGAAFKRGWAKERHLSFCELLGQRLEIVVGSKALK